jgi:hypothetical protein
MTRSSGPDAVEAALRAAIRQRSLPAHAECVLCHTPRQLALSEGERVLCYACRRSEQGARAFEEDHLAGVARIGGLTLRLEPNAHREVTELRAILGMDGWPDAAGDWRLVLAYALAGIATVTWLGARWLVALATTAPSEPPPPPPFVP